MIQSNKEEEEPAGSAGRAAERRPVGRFDVLLWLHLREKPRLCSGSEAGSYLRLIDFVYDSTLGLRVIKKRKKRRRYPACTGGDDQRDTPAKRGVIDSGSIGSTDFHSSHPTGAGGGVPREHKMLKGHLPRVIYHQVY